MRRINGILGELASVALTLLADACTLSANIHDSVHDENTVFIYGKQALSSSIRRQEQVNVRLIGNKNLDSLQKKMKYCSVKLKHLWPRQHLRRLKHQTKAPEHFEWGHPRLSLPQEVGKHWHDRQSAGNYKRNQQKKLNMQIQKCTLEIAFNQLSHSFAENLAMRSFEAETNTCASLSVWREFEMSWWTTIRANKEVK